MRAQRVGDPAGERGFAMVAVLLVLALIGLLGAEFAYSMRLEARAARNYKDTVMAGYLAEAAVENAVREIVGQGTIVAEAEDGELTFYTRERVALKRLPRENVPLGDGHYSYRITDETARFNVNNILTGNSALRFDRLLQLLGIDKQERDTIVDSIRDWIDENGEHRANGAESDDYYLKLPVPYRARNDNLESINELLQIKGITPALFHGTPEKPGLADFVTIFGQGQVNMNTASKLVLEALGLAPARILEIQATRREAPYPTASGAFGGLGLVAATRIYRIEGTGILDGKPRARLTAVVQIGEDTNLPSVQVLSWSGLR